MVSKLGPNIPQEIPIMLLEDKVEVALVAVVEWFENSWKSSQIQGFYIQHIIKLQTKISFIDDMMTKMN